MGTPGSWKKGQSGNPKGRPKLIRNFDFNSACAERTPEYMRILEELAANPGTDAAVKVSILKELLSYGYSKAKEVLDVQSSDGSMSPNPVLIDKTTK